ncbi:restriction system-associated AAA family ATPase [Thiomicrorhabdus sp. 6S2-11]|uniref:Restriction system-associated AAA family ATPase n=1 Tax=Thiomicrorhabdus marina TaxID=2818442 RepID=A0ABS3Q1K8_9GAMM|nr:restriction system-associated AAA family ATPase [Thiomicrorhabdus marina]MBO1926202.1 restriction system-associated AAA family ATPase [Thiomicrorhabdus marina]
MKLLRLKITDPSGFRSLPFGFEHHFRNEWSLQEELTDNEGFASFVCAGPNGSGKSNLLEVLGSIFYHMECLYLDNPPGSFAYNEDQNPEGFRGSKAIPDGFELEYLINPLDNFKVKGYSNLARVCVKKIPDEPPQWWLLNHEDSDQPTELTLGRTYARQLLPDFVLGYSSGENEILSLPFFKMRFIQLDEYWNALSQQLPYSGYPETSMVYLDNSFSQAILLCNLLFQDERTLQPFREDVGIEALKEFRIILRRTIALTPEQLETFVSSNESQPQTLESIVKDHPALNTEEDELGNTLYRLDLLQLLEGDEKSSRMVSALKRCATLSYKDDASDSLILDYWVNGATQQAFKENFSNDPLSLFQAFQVLLTLNLYTVSETLKADLYKSHSHYVSETIPTLASDQRIMRFKFVRFSKVGVTEQMMLKELSDGEHQLLHSLGLCLLFRNTNSLFLLDEPETHFNPEWRANFISRLRQCFPESGETSSEILITTHTPFLISDSKPEKVLVFEKDKNTREVSIHKPEYNTLGASINKITMNTFGKRETIGAHAQRILDEFRCRFEEGGEDSEELINEIHQKLGDSVEKLLLIKAILSSEGRDSPEVE